MKLIREDIKNIDAWLKRAGIKYLDVRYELTDHLVTEYENIENYPDLLSFLDERKAWCKKIAKEKQKAVNFGMTKGVFKKFLSLFTNFKSIVLILITVLLFYGMAQQVSPAVFKKVLFFALVLPIVFQLYLMLYSGLGKTIKKDTLSGVYLINIFGLPQVFAHCYNIIPKSILDDFYVLVPYVCIGVLINITALLFFYEKRKQLQKEFELLKNAIA